MEPLQFSVDLRPLKFDEYKLNSMRDTKNLSVNKEEFKKNPVYEKELNDWRTQQLVIKANNKAELDAFKKEIDGISKDSTTLKAKLEELNRNSRKFRTENSPHQPIIMRHDKLILYSKYKSSILNHAMDLTNEKKKY